MADDPRKDPNDTKSDMGQMGGDQTHSGQKGGQAQSDLNREDYSRTDTSDMGPDTRSLGDEDL